MERLGEDLVLVKRSGAVLNINLRCLLDVQVELFLCGGDRNGSMLLLVSLSNPLTTENSV